jgi:hypothetical protein
MTVKVYQCFGSVRRAAKLQDGRVIYPHAEYGYVESTNPWNLKPDPEVCPPDEIEAVRQWQREFPFRGFGEVGGK